MVVPLSNEECLLLLLALHRRWCAFITSISIGIGNGIVTTMEKMKLELKMAEVTLDGSRLIPQYAQNILDIEGRANADADADGLRWC
jgi:hypothetical protein